MIRFLILHGLIMSFTVFLIATGTSSVSVPKREIAISGDIEYVTTYAPSLKKSE